MAKVKRGAKKKVKKKEKRTIMHGVAHIKATFNNTLISISDLDGNVLAAGKRCALRGRFGGADGEIADRAGHAAEGLDAGVRTRVEASIAQLEALQVDVINRIDWVIDSLQTVLEEKR